MHTSSLLMSNAIVLAHKAPKTQDMTVHVSYAVVRCEDPLEQETAQVGDVHQARKTISMYWLS